METCSKADRSLDKHGKADDNEKMKVMEERAKDQREISVLRWTFVAIQAYLEKLKKSQKNILTVQLKELGGKKVNRRKKIVKIRAKINKIEILKIIERTIKLTADSLKIKTKLTNL